MKTFLSFLFYILVFFVTTFEFMTHPLFFIMRFPSLFVHRVCTYILEIICFDLGFNIHKEEASLKTFLELKSLKKKWC